jgi:hypothetical protein
MSFHLTRYWLVLEEIRASFDFRLRQLHGDRFPQALRQRKRRRMEQNFSPRQPAPRIKDQPPDLPTLIVKQEVADDADFAVRRTWDSERLAANAFDAQARNISRNCPGLVIAVPGGR